MTAALASVALEPGAFSTLGGTALSLGSLPQGVFTNFAPTPRGLRFEQRRGSSGRALSIRDTDFGAVHHYDAINRDDEIAHMPKSPSLRSIEGSGAAGVGTFICNTKKGSGTIRNQERNAVTMTSAESELATPAQKFHPHACSVVGKDAFNHDLMAAAGFTTQSADEVERLVYLRDGSAGKANMVEQAPSGVKRLPASVLGDVDKVVFQHSLYERAENAAATYSGLAGKPMWEGTVGNLASTLEMTRDGQHRPSRRVKPAPQSARSDVSWTNKLSRDSQKKDSAYIVSPTYTSCIGEVLFGSKPGLTTNMCKRPDFRKQFRGAAGKTTHDLSKKNMRHKYPDVASSSVSTAAVSEVSLASSSTSRSASQASSAAAAARRRARSSQQQRPKRPPSSNGSGARQQHTARGHHKEAARETPRRPQTARR